MTDRDLKRWFDRNVGLRLGRDSHIALDDATIRSMWKHIIEMERYYDTYWQTKENWRLQDFRDQIDRREVWYRGFLVVRGRRTEFRDGGRPLRDVLKMQGLLRRFQPSTATP